MDRGRFAAVSPGGGGGLVTQQGLMVGVAGQITGVEHTVDVPRLVGRVKALLVTGRNELAEGLRFLRVVRVDIGRIRRGALEAQRLLFKTVNVQRDLEAKVLLGGKVSQQLEVDYALLRRLVSKNIVNARGP